MTRTINENRNTYTPVLLPNILLETSSDEVAPNDQTHKLELSPMMRPVITKLAMRHPEWKLVCSLNNCTRSELEGGKTRLVLTRFRCFRSDGEYLGYIGVDYRSCEQVYSIENHRTSKERVRGNNIKTKDAAKVVKLAEKYFVAKNPVEVFNDLAGMVSSRAFQVANAAEGRHRRVVNEIAQDLTEYLEPQWDKVLADLKAQGVKLPENCASLPQLRADRLAAAAFYTAYETGNAPTVVIHDNKYMMRRNVGEPQFQILDELPPQFKINMGLLKLAEDNTFIPDVGLRQNAQVFIVMERHDDNA